MKRRTNYYKDLAADYSRPGLVAESLQSELIALSLKINGMQEKSLTLPGTDPLLLTKADPPSVSQ